MVVQKNSAYMQRMGLGNVGAYQASSIPWVSSSLAVPNNSGTPIEVSFYNVTKFVTVRNTLDTSAASSPMRVGFSENGVKGLGGGISGINYFTLDNGESYSGDWKVTKLFLLGDGAAQGATASVVAGLTGIDEDQLSSADLNDWSGSAGVG